MKRPDRLLVLSRHTPDPGHDGASAYLYDMLSYLADRGTEVHFAWLQPDYGLFPQGDWRVPRNLSRVMRLHLPKTFGLRWILFWAGAGPLRTFAKSTQSLRQLLKRRKPRPSTAARPAPTANGAAPAAPAVSDWFSLPREHEHRYVRQLVRRVRPDAVMANFAWLAPLLEEVTPPTRRLVLTHDVAADRIAQTRRNRPTEIPAHLASREAEARLLEPADLLVAITEEDAAVFRSVCRQPRVIVAPKAARSPGPRESDGEVGRILFVGGMNPPNIEGLQWFLTQVWPLLLQRVPRATLYICGDVGRSIGQPPPGVIWRGRVENLEPEYADAAVVIAPLLTGSGMKIKVVDAASHGTACVTTPIGLQGLECLRDAVACVETAPEFATAVAELLEDPVKRRQLGQAAQTAILANLSSKKCYERLGDLLRTEPLPASSPGVHAVPTLGSP